MYIRRLIIGDVRSLTFPTRIHGNNIIILSENQRKFQVVSQSTDVRQVIVCTVNCHRLMEQCYYKLPALGIHCRNFEKATLQSSATDTREI